MHKFLSILLIVLLTSVSSATGQSITADPDPNRFENQIATFTAWDSKNSTPKQAVLFAGSSSIVGWKTADAFPGYPVINRGFGGSHISDQLYHYEKVIGRFDPALIVFYCGENDIQAGKSIEQVFGDYRKLITRIHNDFPNTHFLYVSIKNSTSRLNQAGNFAAFNSLAEEYNRSDERLHYIDLSSPLTTDGTRPDDSFFVSDQLHLNEAGYDAWNKRLSAYLEGMKRKGLLPY